MFRRYSYRAAVILFAMTAAGGIFAQSDDDDDGVNELLRGRAHNGRRLFEEETFGGNGRTCQTCHGADSGTVSPEEARERFARNCLDPLFLHDGSDDGFGHGVSRMLRDATVLVKIALPDNVSLVDDPTARFVTLRRGIPSTLNTPALDPVLMTDGREPNLETQAKNAVHNHAQSHFVSVAEAQRIADFEKTAQFFSSGKLRRFARGGPEPQLPEGRSDAEVRGRRFFLDATSSEDRKVGVCGVCHSGPMLNQTGHFLPPPLAPGMRFQTVLVSELNTANNPVREFTFRNADGTSTSIKSPDPGRALITGESQNTRFDNVNAFKIPTLWGVRKTAPYFHDNSAKTLEDVAAHYAQFFRIVTAPNSLILTDEDQRDMVAYLKLLK